MITFFLGNPYAKSRLGNRRFGKYADEFRGLVRAADLPAATVGVKLAGLDEAYEAFMGSVKVGAVASAVRQGKTVTNDSAIRRLQRTITQQAKLIAGQLDDPDQNIKGTKTATYQEFFPKGVEAITTANKANIETETNTFLTAAKAHPTLGSAGLAAKIEALLADVTNSRGEQLEDGKGGDAKAVTSRDAARKALATAQFRLLLALLDHHAEEPEVVRQYVNEAILKENTGRKAADDAAPENPS